MRRSGVSPMAIVWVAAAWSWLLFMLTVGVEYTYRYLRWLGIDLLGWY